jgi:hypothetical protein
MILELGSKYGKTNKTLYTGLDHWYSIRYQTSWHYNAYCFVTQENITNQKLQHNKHLTQKTITYNETNLYKANKNN